VSVKVVAVDLKRKRIALTMKRDDSPPRPRADRPEPAAARPAQPSAPPAPSTAFAAAFGKLGH
jgi:uncharacterized protein